MGLFDSLFGTNTTNAQQNQTGAANTMLAGLSLGNNDALRGLNVASQSALQGYGDAALGALRTGAAGAQGAINNGADAARSDLTGNNVAARQALNAATTGAIGYGDAARAGYAPYAANGAAASGLLGDALGLNGAAGHDAATAAFQAAPGYQYVVDQATDAAARRAASLGMAASGNTLDGITRLSSNLANQGYGSWLDRLTGQQQMGQQAAGSIAQILQGQGAALANNGAQQAQLLGQLGQGSANIDTGQGAQAASLLSGLGGQSANLYSGLGTSIANGNAGLGGQLLQSNIPLALTQGQNDIGLGRAQDAATNANNGMFSNLFKNSLFSSPSSYSQPGSLFSGLTSGIGGLATLGSV